jgi:hypothetical protein
LQEAFTETYAVKPRLNAFYPLGFSKKITAVVYPYVNMAMPQFLIDFLSIIVLSDSSTSSSSAIFNISVPTVFSEAKGKLLSS